MRNFCREDNQTRQDWLTVHTYMYIFYSTHFHKYLQSKWVTLNAFSKNESNWPYN